MKNNRNKINLGALALAALLPLAASAAEEIPEKCLVPTKVLPEQCLNLDANICLDYFKDRIVSGKLTPAADDKSIDEAHFCLRQFQEQLLP